MDLERARGLATACPFNFRFYSEEFPEFVGTQFNDAFIAELDSIDLDDERHRRSPPRITSPSTRRKPDHDQQQPGVANMNELNAAKRPTTAPPAAEAATPVTPGPHSVFFSIFDQGDHIYDSAVFLDRLRLSTVAAGTCTEGATILTAAKAADVPRTDGGGSNGYTITIANTHTEAFEIDALVDDLPDGFTYTPGSTTGATTADPSVTGQRLRWAGPFALPAGVALTLHFGVTVADEPGTYLYEASAESDDVSITPTGPTAPVVVTPALSVRDASITESNTGTTNATFTVTLSGPSTEPVTVNYATKDVTATGAFATGAHRRQGSSSATARH